MSSVRARVKRSKGRKGRPKGKYGRGEPRKRLENERQRVDRARGEPRGLPYSRCQTVQGCPPGVDIESDNPGPTGSKKGRVEDNTRVGTIKMDNEDVPVFEGPNGGYFVMVGGDPNDKTKGRRKYIGKAVGDALRNGDKPPDQPADQPADQTPPPPAKAPPAKAPPAKAPPAEDRVNLGTKLTPEMWAKMEAQRAGGGEGTSGEDDTRPSAKTPAQERAEAAAAAAAKTKTVRAPVTRAAKRKQQQQRALEAGMKKARATQQTGRPVQMQISQAASAIKRVMGRKTPKSEIQAMAVDAVKKMSQERKGKGGTPMDLEQSTTPAAPPTGQTRPTTSPPTQDDDEPVTDIEMEEKWAKMKRLTPAERDEMFNRLGVDERGRLADVASNSFMDGLEDLRESLRLDKRDRVKDYKGPEEIKKAIKRAEDRAFTLMDQMGNEKIGLITDDEFVSEVGHAVKAYIKSCWGTYRTIKDARDCVLKIPDRFRTDDDKVKAAQQIAMGNPKVQEPDDPEERGALTRRSGKVADEFMMMNAELYTMMMVRAFLSSANSDVLGYVDAPGDPGDPTSATERDPKRRKTRK